MDKTASKPMYNAPRPYDLNDPKELQRLYKEVHGYLKICRNHGGDFAGRNYALEALEVLKNRSPSEPQASVREVLKGENMSLMRDYYQDKPVAAISYNPFTDSQLRTISHWLKCQKDYFEKLAKEHPNEIQYQGMASAASMIKDKWELEQFEKRLDNA